MLLRGPTARLTGVEVAFALEGLLWLAPVLIPVLAVALVLAVPPLVVGVATALVVAGRRLAQLFVSRPEYPAADLGSAVPVDPWVQLMELSEANGGAGTSGATR